jgi:putative oxidoreductase
MAIALLIARLIVGLGVAAHGTQKLFGWFGGYGVRGTGGYMETLGYRPGHVFAFLAGCGEFVGGLLIALGLFGPVGPALLIVVMIVAIGSVHWPNGFFNTSNGYELPLTNIAAALLFAFDGFGAWSLDGALGTALPWGDGATWIVIGIAVLLGLGNLAMRRKAAGAGATA